MNNLYKELAQRIVASQGYSEARFTLFKNHIAKLTGTNDTLPKNITKKLITTAQIFYKTNAPIYITKGAEILSMLLDSIADKNNALPIIADDIYTHAGDFPNIELLRKRYPNTKSNKSILKEIYSIARRDLNSIPGIGFTFTDYQNTLWDHISSNDDVITAAPTSTGKTHTILEYLAHAISKRENAFAAVIVPTRALISELSKKIYDILKLKNAEENIDICTVSKQKNDYSNKTIFVMTQERLFEVLLRGDIALDYLFIDEAHNISDNSRGALLHITIEKILETRTPQIIISTPSERYINAFSSIFDHESVVRQTTPLSPVSKIFIKVKLAGRNMEFSQPDSPKPIVIKKPFSGRELADIVYYLGQGESNIIYRNRPDYCESFAKKLSDRIPASTSNENINTAVDYTEKFIHPDFSLAHTLKKGVAFHYGPLPGAVRTMVEELVKDGDVKFIACTSTLAEGVNLPAKNLFLQDPKQPHIGEEWSALDDVKIKNITGRAGRMLHHFSGNIFLIDHDTWRFQDYFIDKEETPDKVPTFFNLINEDYYEITNALHGKCEDSPKRSSYYTIANRLIKLFNNGNLTQTLHAKELEISPQQRRDLESAIKIATESLTLDTFTLELNPTIGYIQQNTLFKEIRNATDLTPWRLIHPNNPQTYDKLLAACMQLHNAGIYSPQYSSVDFSCLIAKKWMTGSPLKEIISDQITYNKNNSEKNITCDSSIRNVIQVINTDIRFKMASALKCYHTLLTRELTARKSQEKSTQLHMYIEVGGCDERIVDLTNIGLSRETSIEINRIAPKSIEIKTRSQLSGALDSGKLDELHKISIKEITMLLR